jgi:hypothetical protein
LLIPGESFFNAVNRPPQSPQYLLSGGLAAPQVGHAMPMRLPHRRQNFTPRSTVAMQLGQFMETSWMIGSFRHFMVTRMHTGCIFSIRAHLNLSANSGSHVQRPGQTKGEVDHATSGQTGRIQERF